MELAVMAPADRDDEFIADPTAERAGLCEGEVMRVRGHAAAHQACLTPYESTMIPIPQTNQLTQRMD